MLLELLARSLETVNLSFYDSRVDGRVGIIPVSSNGKFHRQLFLYFFTMLLHILLISYLLLCIYPGYLALLPYISFSNHH